ncbi:MAG TPA: ROK family protein [Pirellulales bacterium]|jgi:glucokinase|nr:ROK family protein [Pirellulales bacterium]
MFLGIEIGGTKLQLGVGAGDGSPLVALDRHEIDPAGGAVGILAQVESATAALLRRYPIARIGIGFGGPVESAAGRIIRSHQVEGWQDFPLVDWFQRTFGLPAVLGNDCDVAGLAEARFGAGRGRRVVFYMTIGSGIGGGLIIDGQIYRGHGIAAAEIGHLRPGLHADRPDQTVESLASGWGIAAAAQSRLADPIYHPFASLRDETGSTRPDELRQRMIDVEEVAEEFAADLLSRADGMLDQVTAKLVAQAATDGNQIALDVLNHACQVLGWAIAQATTLLSPDVVVIGGGVSQIGESLLFAPLRSEVERYVFPPLLRSYEILHAQLGEEVVVHGALALAATR